MPADKYLIPNNAIGGYKEQAATDTSAGIANAGDIVALDGTGKLDMTLMPSGVGASTKVIVTSENLSAGDWVNVWNDSGTLKARKADATTNGKVADGFVLSTVTSGNNATVYFRGTNTQKSGLTVGSIYFLHTTAGGETTTAPTGAGNIVQVLGKAVSATEIEFERVSYYEKA